MRLGIASVFQELTLVRELSVERNLFLTGAPLTPWRTIDRRRLRRAAADLLQRHGLAIDPRVRVGALPLGQQQQVEIVRALERHPKVLVLDEATSALGASEVAWLAALVRRLRDDGTIVIFISHRWDEVTEFSDRVAILRNGELVCLADTAAIDEEQAVRLMAGQHGHEAAFPAKTVSSAPVVLVADGLASNALRDVSLALRRGEILGLGGLVGQGQGSLLEALFGAHKLTAGTIAIDGVPLLHPTPAKAIAAGIGYVPQERKTEGLLLEKSVGTNMTLAILRSLRSALGIVDLRAEADTVAASIRSAQIRTRGPSEPIRNLSGGNQQKVLLQRWLLTRPSILLLNDVTRGVDVATKRHIYTLIAGIAREGVAIVWYSTDARELVGVVHRVLVMLQGRVNAELAGDAIATDRIVHASVIDARSTGEAA
jgi:ribose transport system ATP-binding protein